MISLIPKALTAEAFAPFGDVIEMQGNQPIGMNYGMARRYPALAKVDASAQQGQAVISLVHSKKYDLPHQLKIIERHPLGSQAFIPTDPTPFMVIVAEAGDYEAGKTLHAFVTNGKQGINYHAGVWHGLLLTPFDAMNFVCVDRQGDGNNCEELQLDPADQITINLKKYL